MSSMSAPALPPTNEGPTPDAAPASPPPAARPEVRTAWIGALAGGLTAALMAGVFGIYTAQTQIAAEDRRGETEFSRNSTAEVYGEFIAQAQHTNLIIHSMFNPEQAPPLTNISDNVAVEATTELRSLEEATAAIFIYGSERSSEIVGTCMTGFYRFHSAALILLPYQEAVLRDREEGLLPLDESPLLDQEQEVAFDEYLSQGSAVNTCMNDFVVMAREEVGSGG